MSMITSTSRRSGPTHGQQCTPAAKALWWPGWAVIAPSSGEVGHGGAGRLRNLAPGPPPATRADRSRSLADAPPDSPVDVIHEVGAGTSAPLGRSAPEALRAETWGLLRRR